MRTGEELRLYVQEGATREASTPKAPNDEIEARRRLLAEARLGERAVYVPSIGYVAASSLGEQRPVTGSDESTEIGDPPV